MSRLIFCLSFLLTTPTWAQVATTQPSLLVQAAGEWVVASSTGTKGTGNVFVDMIGTPVRISGDEISWIQKWGSDENNNDVWARVSSRLVPKPEVSPLAVDFTQVGGYKFWERVAIMRVIGDELHLCVNYPQGPRPTTFAGGVDGREFVILRRVKIAGKDR